MVKESLILDRRKIDGARSLWRSEEIETNEGKKSLSVYNHPLTIYMLILTLYMVWLYMVKVKMYYEMTR